MGTVEKIQVSWNYMRWLWLNLCFHHNLPGCPCRMYRWYSFILVSAQSQSQGMLCSHGISSPRSYLTRRRKLEIFLDGMPTLLMLCLASILLSKPMAFGHMEVRVVFWLWYSNCQIEGLTCLCDTMSFSLKLVFRNSNSYVGFSCHTEPWLCAPRWKEQLVC